MAESKAEIPVAEEKEQEVFVGPRPFERSEQDLFFGRDREINELLSLVASSRVVLCYAPSGAGKTSLINAGLHPRLEKEGFEVLPSTRVRGLIPEGVDQSAIANIYAYNAILSLAKETGAPAELVSCTMSEYLATVPHLTDEDDFPSPRILIFDQFEELLTFYVERWQERDGFFHQVHDALQADPLLRVLFVMREDYLARIEPFTRILKPLSQARFRLDLLGPNGAQAAVTGPLRGTGRRFKEGVVDSLIEELLKVRVESTQGEATEVVGEYVEPVQLQVVCRNLWTSLPAEVQEITQEHLKAYGDVDHALRDFYESCVAEARTSLRANESNLRQWFEHQLVTPAGTRGIVFRDARQTAGLPNAVVDLLENKHVIRGEWRAGSRWYELTHDRLIEPIQRANERWRTQRQARTNRRLTIAGGVVVLGLVLLSAILSFQKSTAAASVSDLTKSASTAVSAQTSVSMNGTAAVATAAVAAQSAATAAQQQIAVAQEDVSQSKSLQLAAQALVVDNPNLALLLAIGANQTADTPDARRSLHKILSRQGPMDGEFLRSFNPEIISPTLFKRLDNHKDAVVSVAFSPDGQRFVSGSVNGTVLRWDIATGQPIGTSLTTHRSSIESVAYSPDGSLIASTGQDEQISLWNASTGEAFTTIPGAHNGLVTCIAFSPDGKLLASGGIDFAVHIWDLSNGQEVARYKDVDAIWSLAWSPDGRFLASGTFGSTVRFFDTQNLETQRSDKLNVADTLSGLSGPVRSIAWSPDGRILALGMANQEGKPIQGDVILWDVNNRKILVHPLPENNQPVRTVTFDPAGKTLAIGRDDGSIVLWDVSSQQILGIPFIAHQHRVMSIAFSPDGRYLISGGYEGTIAVWNLQAPTKAIAVSPKGDLLATSQGAAISLWDLASDRSTPVKILSGHTDDVLALAFSPDGNTLVSSGKDNIINYWDAYLTQLRKSVPTKSNVPTLQFSPDGSTLALAGENGRVQLYDPVTGDLRTLIEYDKPVIKLQFGEGGKTLQAATKDGNLLTWDLTSFESQTTALPEAQGGITSIALSNDGQKAAFFQKGVTPDAGRAHGLEISFWDNSFDPTVNPDDIDFIVVQATNGLRKDRKFDEFLTPIQSVPMRGAYHFFQLDQPWKEQADLFLSVVKDKGFHFFVLDLEVNPKDGSTTFLSDAEQWLKYVDQQTDGRVLLQVGSYYLTSFGADGDWMKEWPLSIMQYPFEPNRDGTPFLPQGFSEWKIWQYTDKGNNAEFGIGAPGSSTYLALYNGTPQEMSDWLEIKPFSIYDRPSSGLIHPNQAIQVSSLNGIAFSPDGSYLAVTGDGNVLLLNAETGEEISTLSIRGRNILSLSFLSDSNTLTIGTDDGTVILWDLSLLKSSTETKRMLEIACSQVQQNFTKPEWLQYFGADTPYNATCPNALVP